MFLSGLFHRENRHEEPRENPRVPEHLAPTEYFTQPRCDDLKATLGRLGSINVNEITQIE